MGSIKSTKYLLGIMLGCCLLLILGAGCGSGGAGSISFSSNATIGLPGDHAGNTSAGSVTVLPSSGGCTDSTYLPNFATADDPATGLPNHLYHWTHFPLNVYIVSSNLATPDRITQATDGFSWWSQALGVIGKFNLVNSSTQANIIVQFENMGLTNYGAITNYTVNGNGEMQNATITFNMTYLTSVPNIAPVAAHEFGHALGLAGHSPNDTDVMSVSANVYNLTGLSQADINTMKTAYCGVSLTVSGSKAAAQRLYSGSIPFLGTASKPVTHPRSELHKHTEQLIAPFGGRFSEGKKTESQLIDPLP
ncbi:Matrixin [Chthonomonas calidirosea]|uniref:matrixin family metalloprotease n=1 Tax=Chthonomonas calidirosea TaxID=454171 RepID=UPI0006DD3F5A|nr:matrixin family metalloprotease [Chthonomonas calidirosea]CEK18879.1 Matrixin [Chthonomonas calidirosea]CEK18887.1 Matrixin [Chthonomonas calidirosea]